MVELPISKSQLDKLGDRLRDAVEIDPGDLDLFEAVLGGYQEALKVVRWRLAGLGFESTGRLKTMGTLVDKLRRERSFRLPAVRDVAGARVTLAGDLGHQDRAVDGFRGRCAEFGLATSVIDRRADPRSGYRAVHVVVKVGGMPVEVQFRTEFQNLWAQTFERLADRLGRQIRYGGDPAAGACDAENADRRRALAAAVMQAGRIVAAYEEAQAPEGVWDAFERARSGSSTRGYLLVYDRARGKLRKDRAFADTGVALKERFLLEREYLKNKDIEIVVLEAESAEAIRRSHGRYFRTASELMRELADYFPASWPGRSRDTSMSMNWGVERISGRPPRP